MTVVDRHTCPGCRNNVAYSHAPGYTAGNGGQPTGEEELDHARRVLSSLREPMRATVGHRSLTLRVRPVCRAVTRVAANAQQFAGSPHGMNVAASLREMDDRGDIRYVRDRVRRRVKIEEESQP